MKIIYLILEVGSGQDHGAFSSHESAANKIIELEDITGMNCYEIHEIKLYN